MNTNTKLKDEYEYYLRMYDEIKKECGNKYLAIKGDKLLGCYDSVAELLEETLKTQQAGTFLIQYCDVDNVTNIQTFHSRVSFN